MQPVAGLRDAGQLQRFNGCPVKYRVAGCTVDMQPRDPAVGLYEQPQGDGTLPALAPGDGRVVQALAEQVEDAASQVVFRFTC